MKAEYLARQTKLTIIATTILLFIICIIILLVFRYSNSQLLDPLKDILATKAISLSNSQVVYAKQEQLASGLPMKLKIPKLKVDAPIEHLGLTTGGLMDVPKNQDNVGWFAPGQRPGEVGSAVMAGHYGRQNNRGSIFDNLNKLRKGDKIYVENDKGILIAFIVRESRSFDKNANTGTVFRSNDGKAHLNLIACEGIWNRITKSYPRRLVIFADQE